MNEETKLQRYYDPEKIRNALLKMEQFYVIWQDKHTDEKHKKAAKALFEHYRRLSLCILAKEFNPEMQVERVFGPNYIDTIFQDYSPYIEAKIVAKTQKAEVE